MINKLQQLKGKTKLKFYKNISSYYDNMNIRFDEDPFAKNAQGISKIYHEVLKLIKIYRLRLRLRIWILIILIYIIVLLKIEMIKKL